MNPKSIILIFFLCSINSFAKKQKLKDLIPEITDELEQLISDDWFIEPAENGFDIYFCRSCNEGLINWVNSQRDVILYPDFRTQDEKELYFEPSMADSVAWFSLIGAYQPGPISDEEAQEIIAYRFARRDVFKVKIQFEKNWPEERIKEVQTKNDVLKKAVMEGGLLHSNEHIFSDYRFWLPKDKWRKKTSEYDYYFERLPYRSLIYDYSIFIETNRSFFFGEVMFPNPDQNDYYKRDENFIEGEKNKMLKIMALVLGIHDFKVVL